MRVVWLPFLLVSLVSSAAPRLNLCNTCTLAFPPCAAANTFKQCVTTSDASCPGSTATHWQCVYVPPPQVRRETWYPAFKVVTLFYAPPGKQSSVNYGTGSTAGTSQSTSYTTSVGVSYGGTVGFIVGASIDQSFTFAFTYGKTERISKSNGVTIGLSNGSGATDAPDHGFDTFWLWVNPRVDLTYTDGILSDQTWGTADGGPPQVVPFTVRELEGIDPIPSYKTAFMSEPLGLSSNNVTALLAMDPFLDPSYRPDGGRFHQVATQMIWGPDNATDPVPTATVNWSYSSGTDSTFSGSEAERTALMITTGFDLFGIVKSNFHFGFNFGEAFAQGLTTSNSSNESASVMLRSNTPCHAMSVAVYFDKVFSTFVAVPTADYHCSSAAPQVAKDSAGNIMASQLVSYRRSNGLQVQTYTDANGVYPVYQ